MKEVNLNLKCGQYRPYLRKRAEVNELNGIQYIFRFDNNYGASVVKHLASYGYERNLWELAVLYFPGDINDMESHISRDTPITDDVVGYLTDKQVRELLYKIKFLRSE